MQQQQQATAFASTAWQCNLSEAVQELQQELLLGFEDLQRQQHMGKQQASTLVVTSRS
jgi:hypothetical protein